MIIDRIEGERAVVEMDKGSFRDIPLARIHGRARDGAALRPDGDDFVVDEDETARRAERFADKRKRLFRR